MTEDMKKIIYSVLSLSLLATACSKDTTSDLGLNRGITINVTLDEPTRTHLGSGEDALKIQWSKDDEVFFLDGDGVAEYATVDDSYVNTSSAVFNLSKASEAPILAVTPASCIMIESNHISLPTSQKYLAGSYANNAAVVAGLLADPTKSLKLNSLSAFVSLKFDTSVSCLVFEANGGEPVSGIFNIDTDNQALDAISGSSALFISDIPADTKEFIIAVPAGNYSAGFTVKAQVGGVFKSAKAYATGKELKKGVKLCMPELSAASMTECTETPIASAADLQTFLTSNASGSGMFVCDIDLEGVTITPCTEFTGTLDGHGYAIKNWVNTGAGIAVVNKGTIRNIVIDATSKVENGATIVPDVTMIAETNTGLISGCVNNAPISFSIVSPPTATTVGAICCRIDGGGKVENCINNGDITVSYTDRPAQQAFHSGIAGRIIDESTAVRIANCVNNGSISVSVSRTTEEATESGAIYTGGVLGAGTINAGSKTKTTAYTKFYGVVENCENTGDMTVSRPCGGTSTYVSTAGVVGYFEGSVKNCRNAGDISYTSSTEKANAGSSMGGVVSVLAGLNATLENCSNTGTIKAVGYFSNASNVYSSNQVGLAGFGIGGVAGKVGDQAKTVTDCSNEGQVIAETSGTSRYIGGVVGFSLAKMTNCSNSAPLVFTDNTAYEYTGGIVGVLKNSISFCENSGRICVSGTSSKYKAIGGILGNLELTGSVENCINSAEISAGNIKDNAKTYLGGIMGTYNEKNNKITSCTNTGNITCPEASGTPVLIGGLCGQFRGTISACQNDGNVLAGNVGTGSYAGGLSGYSRAHINTSSSNGDVTVTGSNSTCNVGGMIGTTYCAEIYLKSTSINGVVTTEGTCNAGFICGNLYNEDTYVVTLGDEEAPITIGTAARVNGAVPSFTAPSESVAQNLGNLVGNPSKPEAFLIKNVVVATE